MRTYESLEVKNDLEQCFLRGYAIRTDTKKSRNENVSFTIFFTKRLIFVERIDRDRFFFPYNTIIEERPLVMLKNNDGSFFIEVWYDELEFYI